MTDQLLRTKNRKEAHAAAASKGRHVRFSMTMNFNHVPENLRGNSSIGTLKIVGGTLTVEQAEKIKAILYEAWDDE